MGVPFESRACNPAMSRRGIVSGAAQIAVTIENYEQTLRENGVILSAAERRRKSRMKWINALGRMQPFSKRWFI
jgi:hypothetical protein